MNGNMNGKASAEAAGLHKAAAPDGGADAPAVAPEALFVRRPWHQRFSTQLAALVRQ